METSCFSACPAPPSHLPSPDFWQLRLDVPSLFLVNTALLSSVLLLQAVSPCSYKSPLPRLPSLPLQTPQATNAPQKEQCVSSASGCNGDRDGSDESHTTEGTPRGERSTRGIIYKNFLPLSSILYAFCREVALLICPILPYSMHLNMSSGWGSICAVGGDAGVQPIRLQPRRTEREIW